MINQNRIESMEEALNKGCSIITNGKSLFNSFENWFRFVKEYNKHIIKNKLDMKFENHNYAHPKSDLLKWQKGGKLSKELQEHEITFLKRIGFQVVTSKNSKVHVSLFEKYHKENIESIEKMKNGDTIHGKGSLVFHKKEGKVLVKHICHVMTLDNINMILNG